MIDRPPQASGEERLFARIAAGDVEAFAAWADDERALLLRRVRARLGDRLAAVVEAEDVLHDGLVLALRAWRGSRFETHEELSAWLHTILVRHLSTLGRRTRSRRRPRRGTALPAALVQPLSPTEHVAAARPSPDDRIGDFEAVQHAISELDALPDDQRLVCLARDVLGLELASAALILDRGESATSKLHQRARRRLEARRVR